MVYTDFKGKVNLDNGGYIALGECVGAQCDPNVPIRIVIKEKLFSGIRYVGQLCIVIDCSSGNRITIKKTKRVVPIVVQGYRAHEVGINQCGLG